MKVRHQLSRLEPIVLGPLHGVEGDVWHHAPNGKWSIAQIVDHLAISIDLVAEGFEKLEDKSDLTRNATPEQSLMRHMLLGPGKLPEGMKSPEYTHPGECPDPDLAQANFRMGIERTRALVENWSERRKVGVFLPHPVMGDLNLPEWVRFHYVHCRLHAAQIGERLAAAG